MAFIGYSGKSEISDKETGTDEISDKEELWSRGGDLYIMQNFYAINIL